jgi:hypothetical protein
LREAYQILRQVFILVQPLQQRVIPDTPHIGSKQGLQSRRS